MFMLSPQPVDPPHWLAYLTTLSTSTTPEARSMAELYVIARSQTTLQCGKSSPEPCQGPRTIGALLPNMGVRRRHAAIGRTNAAFSNVLAGTPHF